MKEERMDCKKESNAETCTCTAENCERRGICCECMTHHLSRKALPSCMRDLEWLQVVAD